MTRRVCLFGRASACGDIVAVRECAPACGYYMCAVPTLSDHETCATCRYLGPDVPTYTAQAWDEYQREQPSRPCAGMGLRRAHSPACGEHTKAPFGDVCGDCGRWGRAQE